MNIAQFIKNKLIKQPATVSRPQVQAALTNKVDAELLSHFGVIQSDLQKAIQDQTLVNFERSSLMTAIDRCLTHPLMSAATGMFAEVACLTADTKIPLLDGRILTIKEIVEEYNQGKELWLYSCTNEGNPKAEKLVQAIKQPNKAQVLRIWLDNNKYVDASINHKFIKRDGTLCRADELKINDSLLPFHRKYIDGRRKPSTFDKGYECVYDLTKSWESTYKMVVKTVLNKNVNELNEDKLNINEELIIHHKDFIKKNNIPSNLEIMTRKEHMRLHQAGVPKSKEYRKMVSEAMTKGQIKKWANYTSEERKTVGNNISKAKIAKAKKEGRVCWEGVINEEGYVCPHCNKGYLNRKTLVTHLWRVNNPEKAKLVDIASIKRRKEKRELAPSYNHKIIKIESIGEHAVYDITIDGSHLFALDCGIYVHNTNRSQIHNAVAWVTSENKEYKYQIEKMFDIINLEEVIYDWAWTISTFGDLFVEIFGEPGVGIVSVNDDQHPINVSRVDYNGRLVGFYDTPSGYSTTDTRQLIAPYKYSHFRLLGAKRRRNIQVGEQYSEFRTISIMTPDARRLTSKYGQSTLADALPIWKRLRLSEDSILMARITRGVLRYVWKLRVDGNNNNEAVSQMVDSYVSTLKRARSLNVDPNNPAYNDKFNGLSNMEDIILPVWGETNNLTYDKLGGEVDIKWIADVDELRNQLATALKVPLPLLAGYSGQAGGMDPGTALERLDIRFARQARRIQSALINGITRLAQVHLAYQGIDPDLKLFQIHMAETSTAEEKEMVDSLDKSVDVAGKLFDFYEKALGPDMDKKEILDYVNRKFLKLNDADMEKFIRKGNSEAFTKPLADIGKEEPKLETETEANPFKESAGDLKAALPKITKEGKLNETTDWDQKWKNKKVKIRPINASK